jgi:accessory colonization factor AcfC
MKAIAPAFWAAAMLLAASATADTLHVYGPGGPAPAMKEAAAAFGKLAGHEVIVTAGPPDKWLPQAKDDADIIFSGSENMMDAFLKLPLSIDARSIHALYMRPSTILVRKGNPDHIRGLRDLIRREMRIVVVQGAGQVGMWEDAVGRSREVRDLERFRRNIVITAGNSAEAKAAWKADPTLKAWLIWNHWQIDDPELTDMVPVEPQFAIYRDTAVAMTERGRDKAAANDFAAFLEGKEGKAIFARHGWKKRW